MLPRWSRATVEVYDSEMTLNVLAFGVAGFGVGCLGPGLGVWIIACCCGMGTEVVVLLLGYKESVSWARVSPSGGERANDSPSPLYCQAKTGT